MESSRIFVRGLPPSLKDADLRKHFDKFDKKDPSSSALTDAHFIPRRRIGYVGYKTPEAASNAVRFFNKSFIRMSRIICELARPVDEEDQTKKRRKKDASPATHENREKRIEARDTSAQSSKLVHLVEYSHRPSAGLLWSNEDPVPDQYHETELDHAENDDSDLDEYQPVRKKRKTSLEKETNEAEVPIEQVRETHHDETSAYNSNGNADIHEPSQLAQTQQQPPSSDADWLRSRTNRVLDLLDDEDLDVRKDRPSGTPLAAANDTAGHAEDEHPNNTEASQTGKDDRQAHKLEDIGKVQSKVKETNRLLVRNLLYDASEGEVSEHFQKFGAVDEVHICRDGKSGRSKGFAFVQFGSSDEAAAAFSSLNGKPFQGRNLHIEAADAKRDMGLDDVAMSKLPLKVQNQIKRKAGASTETFKWNSMYMSADAVMSSVATRLGVSKSDVLDPTSADAAVKQAHAETKLIQDTQSYFRKNGVNVEAFSSAKRGGHSDTAILVKNFPFGTTASEITSAFERHGSVQRLLIPPSGTIAIVDMEQPAHARTAFSALAYSKFKDSVLLLEKAPKTLFDSDVTIDGSDAARANKQPSHLDSEVLEQFEKQEDTATSSLFADRLPWSVTTENLRDLFNSLDGFLSARVVSKADPKKPGQLLSRGFGFVEFRTKAQAKAALLAMDGHMFDSQHHLILKPSNKTVDVAEERRAEDRRKKIENQRTKVVIKNLPFEATKKDVRALFSPYGQLRSVRVPKKFDSSSRGFAFADFVSTKEASNAMDALRNTHLLGRRLALDFATAESFDPEEEIERMQQKTERQSDKIAIQKLTGGGRKKFRAHEQDEDEV